MTAVTAVDASPLARPAREPSPPLPSFVQIEPVGQCNLRCRMCTIPFREDGPPFGPLAFMPYEDFVRLVDGFPGLTELQLQGLGEPTMHPRFFDMVRYASAKGIAVSCNTNLTLISEKRAAECVQSGLAVLNVSLDAADADTYEYIRVRGHFSKVARNLDRVLDARRNVGTSRPEIRVVAVVMRRNLLALEGLVDFAHARGIDAVWVQQLCHDFSEQGLPEKYRPMREFVEQQALRTHERDEVERVFAAARERAARLGVNLRLPRLDEREHPPGTPGRQRCDWPWHGAYVSYQGLAMPCCMVGTPDRANFGNMIERGVADVWNSAEYNDFRAALDSDQPPDICKACSVYHHVF
ncbi:radical SAM protein [Propionivibrio soli]|uniref:radical SAM protein n=1 Tax=Propionivibrio soli TaxID=2976531 RepID=UPI0021E7959C|nr:radical SAM protein [Propionivibrio soli]